MCICASMYDTIDMHMYNIKVQMGHQECRKGSKNKEEGCARECIYTHTQTHICMYVYIHHKRRKQTFEEWRQTREEMWRGRAIQSKSKIKYTMIFMYKNEKFQHLISIHKPMVFKLIK